METLFFIFNSILLGVGLAVDAFSVSVVNGFHEPDMSTYKKNGMAIAFGGFQALMPFLGWVAVHFMLTLFKKAEPFIPWIAFFLLLFIGGKMVVEVIVDPEPEAGKVTRLTRKTLLIQAIATSIDALSVGFTIAEYGVISALVAAAIIGVVTFVICRVGVVLGIKVGTKLNRGATLLGGIILIGIGIEILVTSFIK